MRRKAHQTLRRVTQDFEVRWHFNASVALIMELVNTLQGLEPLEEGARPEIVKESLEFLTLMLAPMAPHLAEELWDMLGHAAALGQSAWPAYVPQLAEEEHIEIVIQINGRVRGKISVEAGVDEAQLLERVVNDPKIKPLLGGVPPAKQIVVPNKLVNFVLAPASRDATKVQA